MEHAKEFCTRYHELLEAIVHKRMGEVGVPEDRIGMIDPDFSNRLAAFHPLWADGGGVHSPTGRINLDAGLFVPQLLAEGMPSEVSTFHARCPASVRQDAIIAHEYEEGLQGSHEAAEEHVPNMVLAIKEQARLFPRAMRDRRV